MNLIFFIRKRRVYTKLFTLPTLPKKEQEILDETSEGQNLFLLFKPH